MTTPFRLIWFTAYGARHWDTGDGANYDWRRPPMYLDMAKVLEQRGGFDGIVFADGTTVLDTYGNSPDLYVKYGLEGIFHDPVPMLAAMSQATEHLGLVATLSTSFYPPYLLARMMATFDHLSRGRAGWNIVTSTGATAGPRFGIPPLAEGPERYARAEEFLDLAEQLWDSWGEGAVLLDRATGRFADPSRVHEIAFVGKYYKCRGPLTVPRSPQGKPLIMQAGGSDRGRDFAAAHAEMIVSHRNSVAAMKDFREDIHARMRTFDRDPASCKIFFTVRPYVGDTLAEAREMRRQVLERATRNVELGLAAYSARMAYDISAFPLDEPLPPDLPISGSQGVLQQYTEQENPPTLREIARSEAMKETLVVEGDPLTVAEEMAEIMDQVGGDGFAIRDSLLPSSVIPLVDRVVPHLRAAGLVRTGYPHATFRENLMDPGFARQATRQGARR